KLKGQDCSTSISLDSLISTVKIRITFFDGNRIIICQNLLNRYCLWLHSFDLLTTIIMEINFYILKTCIPLEKCIYSCIPLLL
ncbi:mCG145629, partial [Mus musculus]